MPTTNGHPDQEFEDEAGDSDVQWHELPAERDFFASPYDPPVKSLVQEIKDGELIVRPSFQRSGVWDVVRKSKLVESILLNIPIPTLFFAEDDDKSKVVVDGQQRLLALKEYIENRFALKGLEVLNPLNGKNFDDLTERQQRIISNRTLRCLVISARSDSEIRFQVFERLNQGGVPLNAQEVRHCVYRGALNDLLHELKYHPTWLSLLGKQEPHSRMVDCELILRFFALRNSLPNYSPPLKTLLNEYMRKMRKCDAEERNQLSSAFVAAITAVHEAFGSNAFRRGVVENQGALAWDKSVNRAVLDIQLLILEGVDAAQIQALDGEVARRFTKLCTDDEVFADSVSRATADRSRLRYRLQKFTVLLESLGIQPPYKNRIPQPD